jgi:hypothetical protein
MFTLHLTLILIQIFMLKIDQTDPKYAFLVK